VSSAYDAVRNSQISAVVAIFVLIAVLYGGEELGEIYHVYIDLEMDDGSGTEYNIEIAGIMMADEMKLTTDCDSALEVISEGECDESETSDYEDDDEDMMNNFRNLLYLSGASVVVFLVLLQNGDIKNASYAAFAIALLSFVAAIYFMDENTNIMEAENDELDDDMFNNFDFDGFRGSDSTTSTEDGFTLKMDGEWGPGIAWYLALLVIPLCGFYASYSCYSVERSPGGSLYQGGFNEQYELPATQLPSIPSVGGPTAPAQTHNPVTADPVSVQRQAQCVSCGSPFSVPNTASGQNYPCPHCGFVNLVN
jgi:DNA-directed RNA polymerase subunit RPC12/RpoP